MCTENFASAYLMEAEQMSTLARYTLNAGQEEESERGSGKDEKSRIAFGPISFLISSRASISSFLLQVDAVQTATLLTPHHSK